MPTVVHSHAANPVDARTVAVPLEGRAYNVLVGRNLLPQVGRLIATRLGKGKCAIVTDENVAAHHLPELEAALRTEARLRGSIILPPGESTKSFAELGPLCERLLETGLERGDFVVALGGGVIGDLAGFAASILRRGVRVVQIPTSLLAQVDSSVGGKTGINTPQGKNLIGTFHQSSLVVADIATLATLSDRHMRAGYAEIAKYGLLGDMAFFEWLEANGAAVIARDDAAVLRAVETSVTAKSRIVVADEFEAGDRALLNLGHTFGHALEAWTGYCDRLLHGEGVALGMCLAFRFSVAQNLCPPNAADRVEKHLRDLGLPTRISAIPGSAPPSADTLVDIMRQDKKVRDGVLAFILVRGIGAAYVARDVDIADVTRFLAHEVAVAA